MAPDKMARNRETAWIIPAITSKMPQTREPPLLVGTPWTKYTSKLAVWPGGVRGEKIYAAYSESNYQVAIKKVSQKEMSKVARCSNKNIVQYLEGFVDGGCYYMVTEWVNAFTLHSMISFSEFEEGHIGVICREVRSFSVCVEQFL